MQALTDKTRQSALSMFDANLAQGISQMVTFCIETQEYGLPIAHVQEVVRLPALTTVAGAPPACCGMLRLRGNYIPVLDGRILMGLQPSYNLNNQIIILGRTHPVMGLLVDQVNDVRPLPVDNWTPFHKQTSTPVLQGVVTSGDSSILLFDIDALTDLMPMDTIHEPENR